MPYKDKAKAAEHHAKYMREYYKSHPKQQKAMQARAHKVVLAIRAATRAEKAARGCIDCGYKEDSRALQFDHVRGQKRLNVGSATTWTMAKNELAKCEIRCANCHAIRTMERRHGVNLVPDQRLCSMLLPSSFLLFS